MTAVYFLVPLAVALGATFAGLFLYAASKGQFDDLDDAPWRVLEDDGGLPAPVSPATVAPVPAEAAGSGK